MSSATWDWDRGAIACDRRIDSISCDANIWQASRVEHVFANQTVWRAADESPAPQCVSPDTGPPIGCDTPCVLSVLE